MRRDNIKTEIHKIIDKDPDDMLVAIFKVLKDFADKNPDSIQLSHNLNKILTGDKGLLENWQNDRNNVANYLLVEGYGNDVDPVYVKFHNVQLRGDSILESSGV